MFLATDTLASTLKNALDFKWCHGDKETFRPVGLDAELRPNAPIFEKGALRVCMDRGETFTHIMPFFLSQWKNTHTPEDIMEIAVNEGFHTVISQFRKNQLSRRVPRIYCQGQAFYATNSFSI